MAGTARAVRLTAKLPVACHSSAIAENSSARALAECHGYLVTKDRSKTPPCKRPSEPSTRRMCRQSPAHWEYLFWCAKMPIAACAMARDVGR